jgi:lipoprotein-anchoring transpeptidase ErfK/SrfK
MRFGRVAYLIAAIALAASPSGAPAQPYGWSAPVFDPPFFERVNPPARGYAGEWRETPRPWAYPGDRWRDVPRDPYPRWWREEAHRNPPWPATPFAPYARPGAAFEPPSANLRDGGPRPPIAPIPPQIVPFNSTYAPGTIVIDTRGRQLFLVTSSRAALRYPISVGREGFQWTGTEKISRIADWPDWHPPAEMRKRDPSLPEMMTGGIRNPLGAKALYLGSTLYRIHGTNDPRTVGHASSSGCFRMLNGHVVDLASRVRVGTPVVVVSRLPRDAIAWDDASRNRRGAWRC